jgi:hypothetical protein
MTGFLRTRMPPSLDRAAVSAAITRLVSEEMIAAATAAADPFLIDDPCLFNGNGPHHFNGSCGDVVCVHCTKVAWS